MPVVSERGFGPLDWTLVGAGDPIPAGGDVIVPLERWDEAQAMARDGRVGVVVGPAVDPETLVARFGAVALIGLTFAKFNDGRGFSQARRLRALGYEGEVRAIGPLIADQAPMAFACGIDTIQIPDALAERQPEARWLAAIAQRVRLTYQRGYRTAASVFDQRSTGVQA